MSFLARIGYETLKETFHNLHTRKSIRTGIEVAGSTLLDVMAQALGAERSRIFVKCTSSEN